MAGLYQRGDNWGIGEEKIVVLALKGGAGAAKLDDSVNHLSYDG